MTEPDPTDLVSMLRSGRSSLMLDAAEPAANEIERLRAGLQLIATDAHRLMNETARQTAVAILQGKPI